MRSALRRTIGLVTLVLLAALPVGRAVCEVLYAPVAHAAARAETAALGPHASACHEASHSAAPALTALPAHGCSEHTGTVLDLAAWLSGGRADAVARPTKSHTPALVLDTPEESTRIRSASSEPPPGSSSYTRALIASVVLRI